MLRRLLLLSALAAFGSEAAFALGLGEIELESALNQEFEAEIVLTNVRGLEPQEILPGLASQEDFERVGIERTYELTDLRFSVVTNDDGDLAVRITSTRPVVEPFLNFLVEVLWPSGRILREYTVLLDPPVFGEQGVERIAAPVQRQTTPRPAAQRRPEPEPEPEPEVATRERRLDQGSRSGEEYGMTGPGDTLWAIAMDVRPNDNVSVQQMMLALKRANPDAFINNNINLLKAGYVLRIPDEREIREESFQSAVAKVQAENDAFASYRGGESVAQMDASPRRPSSTSSGRSSSQDGELRLLASDGGSGGDRAGQGGGNSARVGELEDQLSVAEEDLDRARRANSELNSRLSDLEEQLETLNEIVKLKDDQLAALRAEVMRMQSEPATSAPAQPAPRAPASGGLLTNPFVLGGLALILVIAAAGGMIFMRRKRAAGDDFEEEEFTTIASEAEAVPEVEESVDDDAPALALEEEEEDVSPQTSDVISEAEIYIAYGRFPQAITFLQNAMEAEPERVDIQLKLLEVYVQTEDATAFNLQLERLRALGDESATQQALEMQKDIPGAAEQGAAAMDATVVSNEPIAPIEDTGDDDDDLSFDLDDLDSETEDDSLDLSDDVDLDDDAEDLDIDLDLDLDDDTGSDDDDLDIDLDLEADSTEDDGGLELDLDDDDELDIDLDSTVDDSSDDAISLDLDDDGDDGDEISLDLDDDSDDDITLDLGDDEDDDGAIELNLDDDDDDLDLGSALEEAAGGDDEIELDLGDEDEISLDLDDDDEFSLDLDDDDSDDGDDGAIELNLDDDDDDLDLDLGDDTALDLDDDDALDLDLGDDDELNLDEDASTKLDLARAYIDMGDTDGARNVLQEVVRDGDEAEKAEANELLEKI